MDTWQNAEELIESRREQFSGLRVELNGEPAVICGFRCKFATVAQVPDGLAYEWNWDAVGRVVAAGGRFHS